MIRDPCVLCSCPDSPPLTAPPPPSPLPVCTAVILPKRMPLLFKGCFLSFLSKGFFTALNSRGVAVVVFALGKVEETEVPAQVYSWPQRQRLHLTV